MQALSASSRGFIRATRRFVAKVRTGTEQEPHYALVFTVPNPFIFPGPCIRAMRHVSTTICILHATSQSCLKFGRSSSS